MLFKGLLRDLENTGVERNMDTTLNDSDARIWYLSKNNELVREVIDLLGREFKKLLIGSGSERNQVRRNETVETFDKMLREGYIPSVITYVKYDAHKV